MRYLATLALFALLGACGQTGPLYLPGEEPPTGPPETTSVTPSEPAPENQAER